MEGDREFVIDHRLRERGFRKINDYQVEHANPEYAAAVVDCLDGMVPKDIQRLLEGVVKRWGDDRKSLWAWRGNGAPRAFGRIIGGGEDRGTRGTRGTRGVREMDPEDEAFLDEFRFTTIA